MSRLMLLCALGACAAPAAEPTFAPALIDVDATSGEVVSHDLAYHLGFAASGVRLPSSLVIGSGRELLANGTCPGESGIGVTVFPAVMASGLNGSMGTSQLTVVMAGPAVARVRVDWTMPYTCQGAQVASGTTTFTLFPTGRIVRTDAIAAPSTTHLGVTPAGAECGCTSDTPSYDVETFWAFRPGTDVDASGAPATSSGDATGCTLYANDGAAIAVSWGDRTTRIPTTSTYVKDFVQDVPTLDPAPVALTSAIQLAASGTVTCAQLLAGLVDPDLLIAGSHVQTDETGIFRVDGALTDAFAITTTQHVPAGFAVSLALDPHAVLTSSAAPTGAWYTAQIDPTDGHTILYFRDALEPGDSIAVEPR